VVDMKMTVRGYMALYAEELELWIACSVHNPPLGTLAAEEAKNHRDLADEYRKKAYDLMGVNTIEQPKQLSFFEAL
jgi:hypothetical protein